MRALLKTLAEELLEAALDQPQPTERLRLAVQAAAKAVGHEDAWPTSKPRAVTLTALDDG